MTEIIKQYKTVKINLILLLYFLLIPWQIQATSPSAEEIKAFADHLFQQEDYIRAAMEYERYLFYINGEPDTILFKIGLCHQFRENYKFACDNFRKIIERDSSHLKKTARLALLYNLSQAEDWERIYELGYRNADEFYFYYQAHVHDTLHLQQKLDFKELENDSLRSQYIALHQKKHNLVKKSSLIAGFLSFLMPGLGKVYLDRKGDGLFSFIMTTLTGFISYRAFQKDLVISGVIGSGISLSFYLGTIYGSYIGAKLFNHNIKKQWSQEIEKLNPVTQKPYWEKWTKN